MKGESIVKMSKCSTCNSNLKKKIKNYVIGIIFGQISEYAYLRIPQKLNFHSNKFSDPFRKKCNADDKHDDEKQ